MSNLISNKVAVIISDLHVGDPENIRLEDFDRDEDFERLLTNVIPEQVGSPATLIINGDFIDFPQVMPETGKHDWGVRLGVTEDVSVEKLRRVIKGHPRVFNALKTFLEKDGAQVIILPGNHDIDLHWPDVFDNFRKAIGDPQPDQLVFVKEGVIDEQRVYIEHGNQHSFDNWFEFWETPFLKDSWNRFRIERPWGTYFMDMVYNDLENLYPFVNKIYPHSRLATIAIRSLVNLRNLTNKDERVSLSALARLVAFLVTDGKFFMLGRLLGKEEDVPDSGEHTGPGALPDAANVEDFLTEIGLSPQDEDYDELLAQSLELIADADPSGIENQEVSIQKVEEHATSYGPNQPGQGLLGRTDARGMRKRQKELWESGKADIIVFGHTHVLVDGNDDPANPDSPRRSFNTGTWIPVMPIPDKPIPLWSELGSIPKTHDVRYVVLEFGDPPRARLQSLSPPKT